MKPSVFVLVSYGEVAANKPLSTKDIEVTPIEQLPMLNGELTDNLTTVNEKGKDADGASFETTVKRSVTLTATWLPHSSNRATAPDVRRGEKVCIWKYGDADKYYWSELEYNGKLRKLETVRFQISNTRDEDADAQHDNTYYFEWSTHNKLVHLHTSTSDGEPFGYDFSLNTKDGNFQITDTIENTIFLDSPAKRIVLKNASGTFMDLNAEDLFINVVRNMVTHVGGNMDTVVKGNKSLIVEGDETINVKGNDTVKIDGDKSQETGGKYFLKAGASYKTETPKADFVTPMLETSAVLKTGGNAIVGGGLSLAKGMVTGVSGSGGSIQLKGGIEMEGSINMQGSITATGGATFSANVIAPNIS